MWATVIIIIEITILTQGKKKKQQQNKRSKKADINKLRELVGKNPRDKSTGKRCSKRLTVSKRKRWGSNWWQNDIQTVLISSSLSDCRVNSSGVLPGLPCVHYYLIF